MALDDAGEKELKDRLTLLEGKLKEQGDVLAQAQKEAKKKGAGKKAKEELEEEEEEIEADIRDVRRMKQDEIRGISEDTGNEIKERLSGIEAHMKKRNSGIFSFLDDILGDDDEEEKEEAAE